VNGACPGAWQNDDLVTYSQDSWGTLGTAASNVLFNSFFTVYPNGIEIGHRLIAIRQLYGADHRLSQKQQVGRR
jgi:hypothetical protein